MKNVLRFLGILLLAVVAITLSSCEKETYASSEDGEPTIVLSDVLTLNKDGSYRFRATHAEMRQIMATETDHHTKATGLNLVREFTSHIMASTTKDDQSKREEEPGPGTIFFPSTYSMSAAVYYDTGDPETSYGDGAVRHNITVDDGPIELKADTGGDAIEGAVISATGIIYQGNEIILREDDETFEYQCGIIGRLRASGRARLSESGQFSVEANTNCNPNTGNGGNELDINGSN